VRDLTRSIQFYTALFGNRPDAVNGDHARWTLSGTGVSFVISSRGAMPGLNHLGFEIDQPEEFAAARDQLVKANIFVTDQAGMSCCDVPVNRYWVSSRRV
jgi:catechol 2,3-dioxygenase-like lactoylglutathione lyase family enzyme